MKTILVVYHSQEKGNTHRMAELVAQGCREVEGVDVRMINVNEQRVDMDAAEQADAYALGSPDYFSYVAGNLDQLALIAEGIAGRTVCPLGDAAAWPMLGFLTKFRDEFEAKVSGNSKEGA